MGAKWSVRLSWPGNGALPADAWLGGKHGMV